MIHRPNFVVFKDSAGEWRFRLVARNGQIVAVGEGYVRKATAKRACQKFAAMVTRALDNGIEVYGG